MGKDRRRTTKSGEARADQALPSRRRINTCVPERDRRPATGVPGGRRRPAFTFGPEPEHDRHESALGAFSAFVRTISGPRQGRRPHMREPVRAADPTTADRRLPMRPGSGRHAYGRSPCRPMRRRDRGCGSRGPAVPAAFTIGSEPEQGGHESSLSTCCFNVRPIFGAPLRQRHKMAGTARPAGRMADASRLPMRPEAGRRCVVTRQRRFRAANFAVPRPGPPDGAAPRHPIRPRR